MLTVLTWFIVAYYGLISHKKFGFFLTIGFLLTEFIFYLQTQIVQYVSGHGILLYVVHPHNWLLFIVFGIGYINFIAAALFIPYLMIHKSQYLNSNA